MFRLKKSRKKGLMKIYKNIQSWFPVPSFLNIVRDSEKALEFSLELVPPFKAILSDYNYSSIQLVICDLLDLFIHWSIGVLSQSLSYSLGSTSSTLFLISLSCLTNLNLSMIFSKLCCILLSSSLLFVIDT